MMIFLIYWWIIWTIKWRINSETCPWQFPRVQDNIIEGLVLSNQQLKSPKHLFYSDLKTELSSKPPVEAGNSKYFTFLLEKWWLIISVNESTDRFSLSCWFESFNYISATAQWYNRKRVFLLWRFAGSLAALTWRPTWWKLSEYYSD